MEKIRLQKCKIMSRRAAESEIAAGKVTVNGAVASVGDKVDPAADVVIWNGKTLKYPAGEHVYIMLHKPRGYLTSMSDDRGRKCVSELVRGVGSRVYPIGRLDLNSEGLLLMTDDGELANLLTHPRHAVGKVYNVSVRGEITEEKLSILRDADAIFREEMKLAGLDRTTSQFFAVLTDLRSVGVMGDERTYDYTLALRAVQSQDFMTATWSRLPYELLDKVSGRIVGEVKHINRICYDITSKPPATVEWE